MLVRTNLLRRNRFKLGEKSVQLAVGGFEVETLEPISDTASTCSLGKPQALLLARDGNHVAFTFVSKEMFQPHSEYYGDAQQGRQGGKELAAFQLREHRGRESRVLAEFHQAHALSQPQRPEFLAQRIRLQPFENCLVQRHRQIPLFLPVPGQAYFLTSAHTN